LRQVCCLVACIVRRGNSFPETTVLLIEADWLIDTSIKDLSSAFVRVASLLFESLCFLSYRCYFVFDSVIACSMRIPYRRIETGGAKLDLVGLFFVGFLVMSEVIGEPIQDMTKHNCSYVRGKLSILRKISRSHTLQDFIEPYAYHLLKIESVFPDSATPRRAASDPNPVYLLFVQEQVSTLDWCVRGVGKLHHKLLGSECVDGHFSAFLGVPRLDRRDQICLTEAIEMIGGVLYRYLE
jgi:hypothetical protein